MRNTALIAFLTAAATMAGCHSSGTNSKEADHRGPPRDIGSYIANMESPDRAEWQQVEQVLAALNLQPGDRVADVGCGPGYFAIPLARAVGPTGVVWAVDIEPKMLERLRQHIAEANVDNIRTVLAPDNDPTLPPGAVDTILIVNTYHHFPDRPAYVAKLKRALTPGGRIANIDFIPRTREARGFGPSFDHQLAREAADKEMAANGLYPAVVHTFLPEQYFVEYRTRGE